MMALEANFKLGNLVGEPAIYLYIPYTTFTVQVTGVINRLRKISLVVK